MRAGNAEKGMRMALYILGHSVDTEEEAPLPESAIAHFYAEPGQPLHSADVLAILAGRLGPVRTERGSGNIKNYEITEDRSAELAREMSYSARDDIKLSGKVLIVGRDFFPGARLCTDSRSCSGSARHTCSGLLSHLEPGGTVHLVFCRGEKRFFGRAAEDKQARSQDLLAESRAKWAKIGTLPWDDLKVMWGGLADNEKIELLTVNSEAEDFVACLHIESYAKGNKLAAYRAHLASQRERGGYVASIYSPPEYPIKALARAGKESADSLERDAFQWLREKGDRDGIGASLAGSWQGLSLEEQAHVLAIDDDVEMRGSLPIGPIRQWLNGWFAVSGTSKEWFPDGVARPADEWFERLGRHNAEQLNALLDADAGEEKAIEYVQHEAYFLILGDDPSWFLMEAWIRSQSGEQPQGDEEKSFTATKTAADGGRCTFSVAQVDDTSLEETIIRWIGTIPQSQLEWKQP
jgi:hypothetical protein